MVIMPTIERSQSTQKDESSQYNQIKISHTRC